MSRVVIDGAARLPRSYAGTWAQAPDETNETWSTNVRIMTPRCALLLRCERLLSNVRSADSIWVAGSSAPRSLLASENDQPDRGAAMRHLLSSMLAVVTIACAFGSCDPVREDAIAALGGETPGVPPGPLHRPGQPCLLCHDGAQGDPAALSIAGTVYAGGNTLEPEVGATVMLQSADGTSATATTNAAGNFFLTPDTYAPDYPVHVTSITQGNASVTMHSHIGRNGSCAGCHSDPAGPSSPGHVYFSLEGTSP